MRCHKIPAIIRRSAEFDASFSTIDAMVMISEKECVELAMTGWMDAVCWSKFCRIDCVTVAAVAFGKKKYVSGKRYPSSTFVCARKVSAVKRGRSEENNCAICFIVEPSGMRIRTGIRPYAPTESACATEKISVGCLN